MAEESGFLGRWSARKRAAREAEARIEPAPEPMAPIVSEPEPDPVIDPADLPPLESIKSGLDVQAFLQRGVPKALRQAALRRLWAVDPKISTFREVADYDWDFNAPGYGALLPGDDPKALAEKLFQAVRQKVAEVEPVPQPDPPVAHEVADAAAADAEPVPATSGTVVAVPAVDPRTVENDRSSAPRRRRHGKAMPL